MALTRAFAAFPFLREMFYRTVKIFLKDVSVLKKIQFFNWMLFSKMKPYIIEYITCLVLKYGNNSWEHKCANKDCFKIRDLSFENKIKI